MSKNKKKQASGTWFTRELLESPAYILLSNSGKTILSQFMLMRSFDKNHNLLNRDKIYLTYKRLENILVVGHVAGVSVPHTGRRGMSRTSISRGIDALLKHGFIRIVSVGGMFEGNKTVYGFTEEWKYWKEGMTIRKRDRSVNKNRRSFK